MINTAKVSREEVKIRLLEHLRRQTEPTVRNSIFAREINAKPDTMRRAVKELKAEGIIAYNHGISRLLPSGQAGVMFAKGLTPMEPEVLVSVAQLAEKHQAIILDLNPVSVSLAQHLPTDLNALIITNSPIVVAAFAEHSQFQIRVIGGQYQKGGCLPLENEEFKFLETIQASLCVLGSCYVDLKWITSHSREDARLKAAMVRSASKVVISVSAESLNMTGPYKIGSLESLTHIVLEDDIPAARLNSYKAADIEILRA